MYMRYCNLLRVVGLSIVFLVLNATSTRADTVTFNGTTAGGPTWNRPVAGTPPTPPLSSVGTAVRYSITQITVGTSGAYSFLAMGTNPLLWDNYTFLYQNSFNPASPFTNVLIGNDDAPIIGLSGFTFNLNAGTTYFFVVTGFSNTDFGAWSTMANGPGTITVGGTSAVPEPATMLLLGSGLVGIGMKIRRRRRSERSIEES
jgi:hypothetical protein